MPNSIDERTVQMQFDNDDFQRGVESSLRSIDKLDEGLTLRNSNKAVEGLNDISNKLAGLNGDFGAFGGVSNIIEGVTGSFLTLKNVIETTVISLFTNELITAGTQLTKSLSIDQVSAGWTKYADKTSAVQTIMAATAKDFDDTGKQMEYVNAQLDKLMWFTDETSYNFVDMVGNIGKFTSQGINLEDSVTSMQGIATWAAISGGNAQSASRAMYNLSQALGLGSVRVQDWMSIENANMATVEFKETVLETAVEMGTLQKTADGVYKTLGKKGKEVSVQSFRENLKEGWFTSEVLISTLENYGKFTDILASATEETNMTATELLKSIDDYMEGTISISDIVEETGLSASRAKELYDELSSSTYDLGRRSFKAAQEAKTFAEAIDATKDAVSSQWMASFEIIFGDYEEAKQLWTGLANTLWDVFASGGEARNKALKEWKDMGGRDAAIEAASNAYNALASIASVAKKAVDTVFTPLTAERLKDITFSVRDFTASISEMLWYDEKTAQWQEDSEKGIKEITETTWEMSDALHVFRRILQGALSVVSIGVGAFKALAGGIIFAAKAFGGRSGGLFEDIASFADLLSDLRVFIEENDIFGKFVDKLKPSIDTLAGMFSAIYQAVRGLGLDLIEYFNPGGVFSDIFESFNTLFDGFVGKLPGYISKFGASILSFIATIRNGKYIQNGFDAISGVIDEFKAVLKDTFSFITGFDTFGDFFTSIKEKAAEAKDSIKTYIEENDIFNKVISKLKIAGRGFVDNLLYIFTGISNLAKRIKTSFGEGGTLNKAFTSFGEILDSAVSKFSPYITGFKDFFNNFLETTEGSTVLEKIFNRFTSALTNTKTKITDFFSEVDGFDTLGEKFTAIIDKVKEAIKSFFETKEEDEDKSLLDKIKDKLAIFQPLIDWFNGIAENIKANWDEDSGLIRKAFDAISSVFEFVFTAVSGIFNWAKKVITGNDINLFSLIMGYFSLKGAANAVKGILSFKDIIDGIGGAISKIREGTASLFGFGDKSGQLGTAMLKIAASIAIVAGAILLISMVDPDRLPIAIFAVASIAAGLIIISKYMQTIVSNIKEAQAINKVGTSFLKIAASILLIAIALKKVSELDYANIGKGLLAIGAMLFEFVAFIKLIGKDASVKLSGMVGLAIGIVILVQAMKSIAKMDTEAIVKGLIGVGAILIELGVFMRIAQAESKGFGKGKKGFTASQGFGVLSVAAGILIMVQALKQVADLDSGTIIKGLIGVGAIMLELIAFTKLAGSTNFKMGIGIGALAAIGGILILIQAMKQIGELSVTGIIKGLAGLGLVMIELALFTKSLGKVKNLKVTTVLGLLGISAALILVGFAMEQIADIPFSGIVKSIVAFGAIFVAIGTLSKMLGNGVNILGTVVLVGSIAAAMLIMVLAIQALALVGLENVTGIAVSLSAMFAAIGVAFFALSKISIGGTISAIGSLAVAIGGIALIIAAAGAIAQIPGFDWLMNEGARALALVGAAIGGFAGAIIGGFGASVSAGFPIIGQNLSDFMTNAASFFTGLDGIDDSKVSAVGNLVDLVMKLTAAEFLSGITSFITGGTGVTEFATQLPILGMGVAAFALAVSGIDSDAVEAGTAAGQTIAGLVDAIPATGGWAQKITGEADIQGFANKLPILGMGIAAFALAVSGINSDAATNGANAGLAIAGLIDAIPETNGWAQKITGEADIEGFATSLPGLGKGIKDFADEVSGIDADSATNGANAGLAIAGLVEALPETGGWAQKITGEADVEGFSRDLPILGAGIKGFADAVSDIDADVATNATNVGQALTNLANDLPKEGGIAQAIFGSQSLGTFAEDITAFGEAIGNYNESISGFSDADVESSDKIVDMLIHLKDNIPKTGGISAAIFGSEDLGTFASNISTFASSISSYSTTISGVDIDKMNAVSTQVQKIIDLSNSISGNNSKNIKKNLAGIVDSFVQEGVVSLIDAYSYEGQFSDAGMSFVGFILDGIDTVKEQFSTSGANVAKLFLDAISPDSDIAARTTGSNLSNSARDGLESIDAYSAGVNFAQGYINGMKSKASDISSAASALGKASLSALSTSIDENSPSKLTYSSGSNYSLGYINGLRAYMDKVYYTARDLGEESLYGLSDGTKSISAIYDILDIQPTITPVLDLSEIERGSGYLDSLLNPIGITSFGSNAYMARNLRYLDSQSYQEVPNNKDVVDAVDALGSKIDSLNENIKNLKMVTDTGALVGSMVQSMDKALGKQAVLNERRN